MSEVNENQAELRITMEEAQDFIRKGNLLKELRLNPAWVELIEEGLFKHTIIQNVNSLAHPGLGEQGKIEAYSMLEAISMLRLHFVHIVQQGTMAEEQVEGQRELDAALEAENDTSGDILANIIEG